MDILTGLTFPLIDTEDKSDYPTTGEPLLDWLLFVGICLLGITILILTKDDD